MLPEYEKHILKYLQDSFPLYTRPYLPAAEKFGISENEVVELVRNSRKNDIVRYVGALFDLARLGFCSTLIAMHVPKHSVKRVTDIINAYPEVTHNYLRKDNYNVWFTISAPSKRRLASIVKEIRHTTGISDFLNLKTEKVFKIDGRFAV